MPSIKPTVRILIIDDDEDDFFITSEYLRQVQEYILQIEWCYRFNDAVQHMQQRAYDMYLLTIAWEPRRVSTF